MANANVGGSPNGMPGLTFDGARAWAYAQRIARLDDTAFTELASDETATLASLLLPAVLVVGYALAAWAYVLLEGAQGLNVTQFVLREVIFGSLFGWLAWFGWVALTRVVLVRVFHRTVELWRLVRVMGFAVLPLALTWPFFLIDVLQGESQPIANMAFGLLVVSYVIIPLFGLHAARAAVSDASAGELAISVALTYLVAVGMLAFAGYQGGMAPALALYGHGARFYYNVRY